jgi:hypothetical protein
MVFSGCVAGGLFSGKDTKGYVNREYQLSNIGHQLLYVSLRLLKDESNKS